MSNTFHAHARKYLFGALAASLGAGSYIVAEVAFSDFQTGTTISAAEMNAKLNALKDAVNALEVPDVCPANSADRYTDNGDGTICDSQTGLMWEKKVGVVGVAVDCRVVLCLTTSSVNNLYLWGIIRPDGPLFREFLTDSNHSPTYSNDGTDIVAWPHLGVPAAYTDWRIPNVVELRSILLAVCPGGGMPCIDPVFGPTQAFPYWTSTADGPDGAWFVNFDNGVVGSFDKITAYHARAVRGGR